MDILVYFYRHIGILLYNNNNIFLMAMALGYKSLIKIRCVSHFHVPQSCMSWAQVA